MSACVLRMVWSPCAEAMLGKLQETTMQLSEMVQVDQCIDSVNGTVSSSDGTPCIEERLENGEPTWIRPLDRKYIRMPITSSLQNTGCEAIQIADCLTY